jgi:hypothetical protein
MSHVRVGMGVSTSDGKRLGKVKEVGSGTFEVEKGVFFRRAFSASYDELAGIENNGIVLAFSTADLDAIRKGN